MSLIEDLESYSMSNFISFMDEVYFRLFERQFEAWWPAHAVMLGLGMAIIVLACLGKPRVLAVASAVPLAFCALTFHFQLYSELTPVGKFFGWAFLIQLVLLLIWGFVVRPKESFRVSVHAIVGIAIAAFGLVGYPILTQLDERKWQGAEFFGMAPDPTICFLFGLMLICVRPAWYFLLFPIPLLWTFATYGTLDVLDAPYSTTLPTIATIAVVVAIWKAVSLRMQEKPDRAHE